MKNVQNGRQPVFFTFKKKFKMSKMTQNRPKIWSIVNEKCPKSAKIHVFYILKKIQNDPKSTKSMGYSPCKMAKMTDNLCFLGFKNISKCVEMTFSHIKKKN
jgi:hypothetical protein